MYFKEIEHKIHTNVNNQSLVSCARIAELVKDPPVIPYYEGFTFSLLARYYRLTEKRLRNAYGTNRHIFANDCTQISGCQMLHYVNDVKNLGVHNGYLCEFANGVVVQIAYSANMIFNYRALLNFAVILRNESETAKQIYDVLHKNEYRNCGYLDRKKPWFAEFKEEQEEQPAACPYVAMMKDDNKSHDDKPLKPQSKRSNAVKISQLDTNGNTVHIWNSVTEASDVLGIRKSSIYNCLYGKVRLQAAGNTALPMRIK